MARNALTRLIPLRLRREALSWIRWTEDQRDRRQFARDQAGEAGFPCELFSAGSPLERVKGAIPRELQQGKERNISLVAPRIDGTVVRPGEVFSFHALAGRPGRLRGFSPGLELRGGEEASGVGGGLCQVSNLLYLLAINSGMRVTERHRHDLDLFPDHQRTVPFGCGATVSFRHQDLRFENPLDQPVRIRLQVTDGRLAGSVQAPAAPGYEVMIEERGHRFFLRDGARMRENEIWRIITDRQGEVIREELLAHNVCRVVY